MSELGGWCILDEHLMRAGYMTYASYRATSRHPSCLSPQSGGGQAWYQLGNLQSTPALAIADRGAYSLEQYKCDPVVFHARSQIFLRDIHTSLGYGKHVRGLYAWIVYTMQEGVIVGVIDTRILSSVDACRLRRSWEQCCSLESRVNLRRLPRVYHMYACPVDCHSSETYLV